MKKYYQTLSSEKKNKIKELYKKEYSKSDLHVRLTRLLLYSCVGYIFAVIILLSALFLDESKTSSIIISIILFVVSSIFIIGRYVIKLNILNDIALENKRI